MFLVYFFLMICSTIHSEDNLYYPSLNRINSNPSQRFYWMRGVHIPYNFSLSTGTLPAVKDNARSHNPVDNLQIGLPRILPKIPYRITIDLTDVKFASSTPSLLVEQSDGSIRFLFRECPKKSKKERKKNNFSNEKYLLINEALSYIDRHSSLLRDSGIAIAITTKYGAGFLGIGDIHYVLGRLSQIDILNNLRELSLCRNNLCDVDAQHLASWLPYITSPIVMKLDNCNITNYGRILINRSISNRQVFISDTKNGRFFYSLGQPIPLVGEGRV